MAVNRAHEVEGRVCVPGVDLAPTVASAPLTLTRGPCARPAPLTKTPQLVIDAQLAAVGDEGGGWFAELAPRGSASGGAALT